MTDLLLVSWAHLLAVAAPGPDFFLVLKNSLTRSRRTALFTSLGITTGVVCYVLLCLTSFTWLQQTPALLKAIKYLGSGYLLFLSFKMLTQKNFETATNLKATTPTSDHFSNRQAFVEGLLCNLLNPKAALFFLSLFSVVLTETTSFALKLSFFISITLITLSWFCLMARVLSVAVIKTRLLQWQPLIAKWLGIVLLGCSLWWLLG